MEAYLSIEADYNHYIHTVKWHNTEYQLYNVLGAGLTHIYGFEYIELACMNFVNQILIVTESAAVRSLFNLLLGFK